jgi:hypothetical protein
MWLGLLACRSPEAPPSPDASSEPQDTASSPTGDTGETVPLEVELSLSPHPTVGSLVVAVWEQPVAAPARVEYSFDEGVWLSTPEQIVEVGPAQLLLRGIPYDTPLAARLVWDTASEATSAEVSTSTGPLPEGFPVPTLLSSDPELFWTPGQWLLGSINSDGGGWNEGQYWMFILDRQGRVVWALRGLQDNFTIYLHVSLDGEILWDESTFWSGFDQGASSKIRRMTLDGTVTEVMDAPGMHHCFLEMPDGSIVWGSADGFDSERLMRRWPDGTVTEIWDCAPFYASLGLTDWCHTNSIVYDEPTDTFLLSFPTDDTFVLEIDANTGEELRWFGHIPQSWAFDEPSSAFQYQHGVTWTEERTLLMSSQLGPDNIDALVREYVLDEQSATLTQIWAFGAGDGIDARHAGEAHRLPDGNTLHNTGTTPRVREITAEGQVAWDLAFGGDRLLGRTIWLEDLYELAP